MKIQSLKMIMLSLIISAGVAACKHDLTQTSSELTPEQLANVGARIYATPENQSAILSDAGMSESDFRLQIENISTSTDASSRYRQEFEQQLLNYHK